MKQLILWVVFGLELTITIWLALESGGAFEHQSSIPEAGFIPLEDCSLWDPQTFEKMRGTQNAKE